MTMAWLIDISDVWLAPHHKGWYGVQCHKLYYTLEIENWLKENSLEIENWLKENCRDEHVAYGTVFAFKNKADAAMFKLFWS
jgi:hypothetical protein